MTATDYYMHFYIIVLFPLTSILQLINFTAFYKTDTALKVFRTLYCFTTSISHGVEKYFPRLWGTGISDAIFRSSETVQRSGYFLSSVSYIIVFKK